MKKESIKYLNEVDKSHFLSIKLNQTKDYIDALLEERKEMTENENVYSAKWGTTSIKEIENFIK